MGEGLGESLISFWWSDAELPFISVTSYLLWTYDSGPEKIPRRGGGYLSLFWTGMFFTCLQILTIFQTRKSIFSDQIAEIDTLDPWLSCLPLLRKLGSDSTIHGRATCIRRTLRVNFYIHLLTCSWRSRIFADSENIWTNTRRRLF